MGLPLALRNRDVAQVASLTAQYRRAGPIRLDHLGAGIRDVPARAADEYDVTNSRLEGLAGPGDQGRFGRKMSDDLVHHDGPLDPFGELSTDLPRVGGSVVRPSIVVFIDQFGYVDRVQQLDGPETRRQFLEVSFNPVGSGSEGGRHRLEKDRCTR